MKLVDHNLPVLRAVMSAVREKKQLPEILSPILESSCTLTGASRGSFVIVDHDERVLRITATYGDGWTDEIRGRTLTVGEGLTGRCARDGQPVLCNDVSHELGYVSFFEHVCSELVVPVFIDGSVWGVVNLDVHNTHAFTEDHLTLMLILAEIAAFAIQQRVETEQHERLQAQLSQTEKLVSLGKIIAGIAHEINNPLTSIVGHAQLLLLGRGGKEDEESLNIILTQSERAASLVHGLLAFARKEASKKQIIGINEIIREVVNLSDPQAKLSDIKFVCDLAPISYPVVANFREIQQVLLNILGNAQDAISRLRKTGGEIHITSARHEDLIHISIQDNGSGIPPEILKQIFDPFFTTKGVGKGTGLGLSIAHSIIAQHGGTLSAESSQGNGATFVIKLPMAGAIIEPQQSRVTELLRKEIANTQIHAKPLDSMPVILASPATERPHVLVVDDEPHIVSWLTEFLTLLEFDVSTACNGNEALEKVRSHLYQVVVSDLRMPGLDGLEFYASAKTSDLGYSKRFVFITGDLARQETRDFLQKTQCPFLEKPFTLKAVQEAINKVLAAHEKKG